jgi:hypothetical protein
MEVETGVRSGAPGVGGDLDLVAAAEVASFVGRVRAVRPDLALFVVDTTHRLSDKALPMLVAAVAREGGGMLAPRRVVRHTWMIGKGLHVANGREDLVENVCRAVAEGLRELAPGIP